MYGMITADGNLYLSGNIIKIKDKFRKFLVPFRQFPIKKNGFKIKNDSLTIYLDKKFPEGMKHLLMKSDNEVEFIIKNWDTIILKEKKKDNEQESGKETEENKNTTNIQQENNTNIKKLIVTKKLQNIKPGKYEIIFEEPEVQWVLIVLKSGKRISVKSPGEIIETEESIKSITPINNRKHKNK